MDTVEEIEHAIERLSHDEIQAIRLWIDEVLYDPDTDLEERPEFLQSLMETRAQVACGEVGDWKKLKRRVQSLPK